MHEQYQYVYGVYVHVFRALLECVTCSMSSRSTIDNYRRQYDSIVQQNQHVQDTYRQLSNIFDRLVEQHMCTFDVDDYFRLSTSYHCLQEHVNERIRYMSFVLTCIDNYRTKYVDLCEQIDRMFEQISIRSQFDEVKHFRSVLHVDHSTLNI
jgi:hypothetical protein